MQPDERQNVDMSQAAIHASVAGGEEQAGLRDADYQAEMRQIDYDMELCVSHFKSRLLDLLSWR